MKDKMFLNPGYVEALRLLDDWERNSGSGHLGESTEKAFRVRIQRYDECTRYFQDIYVRPDENGVFLLYMISSHQYNNSRVVPEIVCGLVEEARAAGEFVIIEWPKEVDRIETAEFKAQTREFCFWAVKKIIFKDVDAKKFAEQLRKFAYATERLSDRFLGLYSSS